MAFSERQVKLFLLAITNRIDRSVLVISPNLWWRKKERVKAYYSNVPQFPYNIIAKTPNDWGNTPNNYHSCASISVKLLSPVFLLCWLQTPIAPISFITIYTIQSALARNGYLLYYNILSQYRINLEEGLSFKTRKYILCESYTSTFNLFSITQFYNNSYTDDSLQRIHPRAVFDSYITLTHHFLNSP